MEYNKPISFASGNMIGLIIRGKAAPNADPFFWLQHADCILSDGTLVGFFGPTAEPYSGGSWSGPSAHLGMDRKGEVYYGYNDYIKFKRKYYLDANDAKKHEEENTTGLFGKYFNFQYISTVILVKVSAEEAKRFDNYWKNLRDNPPRYDYVGNNCSTRAAGAFESTGILQGEIKELDTPDNLYNDIIEVLPSSFYSNLNSFYGYADSIKSEVPGLGILLGLYKALKDQMPIKRAVMSGYVGFNKVDGGCTLTVESVN